jgi:hypothetical protein
MDLFQDPQDIAFALSTDGAQLTIKKKSDTWPLLLMVLNFPPEMWYKSHHINVTSSIHSQFQVQIHLEI